MVPSNPSSLDFLRMMTLLVNVESLLDISVVEVIQLFGGNVKYLNLKVKISLVLEFFFALKSIFVQVVASEETFI